MISPERGEVSTSVEQYDRLRLDWSDSQTPRVNVMAFCMPIDSRFRHAEVDAAWRSLVEAQCVLRERFVTIDGARFLPVSEFEARHVRADSVEEAVHEIAGGPLASGLDVRNGPLASCTLISPRRNGSTGEQRQVLFIVDHLLTDVFSNRLICMSISRQLERGEPAVKPATLYHEYAQRQRDWIETPAARAYAQELAGTYDSEHFNPLFCLPLESNHTWNSLGLEEYSRIELPFQVWSGVMRQAKALYVSNVVVAIAAVLASVARDTDSPRPGVVCPALGRLWNGVEKTVGHFATEFPVSVSAATARGSFSALCQEVSRQIRSGVRLSRFPIGALVDQFFPQFATELPLTPYLFVSVNEDATEQGRRSMGGVAWKPIPQPPRRRNEPGVSLYIDAHIDGVTLQAAFGSGVYHKRDVDGFLESVKQALVYAAMHV